MGKLSYIEVPEMKSFDLTGFYKLGRAVAEFDRKRGGEVTGVYIVNRNDNYSFFPSGGALSRNKSSPFEDLAEDAEDQVEAINQWITGIMNIVRSYDLAPTFVEISLFEPADRSGQRFYTILYGSEYDVLRKYLLEMEKNLLSEGDPKSDRGVIVPCSSFYASPLFYKFASDPVPCKFLETNRGTFFIGTYDVKIQAKDINIFKGHLEAFWKVILEDALKSEGEESLLFSTGLDLQGHLDDGKSFSKYLRRTFQNNGIPLSPDVSISIQTEGRRWLIIDNYTNEVYIVRKEENKLNIYAMISKVDTALVISLPRPAAALTPEQYRDDLIKQRGGALFIYGGKRKKERKQRRGIYLSRMALSLRHRLILSIMEASYTQVDYDLARYKSRSAVLHSVPHAFSSAIEYLIDYQHNHPDDFSVPVSLYSAALETALYSRGLSKEEFFKFMIRLPPIEKIMEDQGICDALFQELAGNGRIARKLAEARLANDRKPIFSSQLKRPPLLVEGCLPVENLKLEQLDMPVLIGLLLILLKEAIEHTERYIRDVRPSDENRKAIHVSINVEKGIISIKNPCIEGATYDDSGNQAESIRHFEQHLGEWKVEKPEIKDGWWVRNLVKYRTRRRQN